MSESYEYNDSSLSNKMNDESVNAYIKENVVEYVKEYKREVAKRVFSFEFNASDRILKRGTGQYAKKYLHTPTGLEINRLFIVGTLIEKRKINADFDFWQGKVADPFGTFQINAGKYQPQALRILSNISVPMFIAVIGKPSVYKRNNKDENNTHSKFSKINTFINAESIYVVDLSTRNQWVFETAECMIERIKSYNSKECENKLHSVDLDSSFPNILKDDYLLTAQYAIDSIK